MVAGVRVEVGARRLLGWLKRRWHVPQQSRRSSSGRRSSEKRARVGGMVHVGRPLARLRFCEVGHMGRIGGHQVWCMACAMTAPSKGSRQTSEIVW